MTVNLYRRQTTVAVGGKDFSPGMVSVNLTQDLVDSSKGYVSTRGQLIVQQWQGLDESLDPHLNRYRWAIGREVAIAVANTQGELTPLPFGMLYILGGNPSPDNRRLELEIGDWLALEEWRSTESPDEEPPDGEETAIASYPRQTLLTDLLKSVEMTLGSPIASDWIGDRIEALQGSYLALAGGLSYGSETPSILWGHGKTARLTPIDVAPHAPWCQVTLGRDEALYEPQTAEFPVETYIASAEGYETAEGDWEADDPGCVRNRVLDDGVDELSIYCVSADTRTVSEIYTLKEPANSVDPDGGTELIQTLDRRTLKTYGQDDDRLYTIETTVKRPKIAVLSGAAKEQETELSDPLADIISEKELTTYYYNDELGVITTIVHTKSIAQGQLAPKYSNPINWSTRNVAEKQVEEWFQSPGGEWLHRRREYRSRILVNSQLVEKLAEEEAYDMVAIATNLTAVPQGGLQGSTSGQTQPPGIEYFPESTDNGYQSKTLEGRATFKPLAGYLRKPRETEESIPFASTETALKAAAKIGGTLRLGRYQGRSLKLPIPDKFFTSYEPLRRIDVIEPAGVKTFLADGAILVLERTEAALFFPHMIWLGTAPAQGVKTTAVNITPGPLKVKNPEEFEVGQTVQFAPTPGGGLPSGLESDRPYTIISTTGGLKVSATPDGPPIPIGAAPPVHSPLVLPVPDPVTGVLGTPEPAYGGAAFIVLPTAPHSDPAIARPVVPPFTRPLEGEVDLRGRILVQTRASTRKAGAIALTQIHIRTAVSLEKIIPIQLRGVVRVTTAASTRKSVAIAHTRVRIQTLGSINGAFALEGAIRITTTAATRQSGLMGRSRFQITPLATTRRSGFIAVPQVQMLTVATTRRSGFMARSRFQILTDGSTRKRRIPVELVLFMAHSRGLNLRGWDAEIIGATSTSPEEALRQFHLIQ